MEQSTLSASAQATLTPSPLGRRICAAIVDLAIVSALLTALTFPLAIALGVIGFVAGIRSFTEPSASALTLIILLALSFVLLLLLATHAYYIYFEGRNGQTPGKSLFALRAVSSDGRPLSRKQAVYREISRWYLDSIFLIPSLLVILLSAKRQRIGDLLADTLVIIDPSVGAGRSADASKSESAFESSASAGAPSLRSDETLLPGGFWRRFWAALIDGFILAIVSSPLTAIETAATFAAQGRPNSFLSPAWILMQLVSLVVGFFYYAWFYKNRGASPGKMLLNLRVMNSETGARLSYGQTFCREMLAKILSGPLTLGIGFLMAAFRQDKRALHDLVCATRVVHVVPTLRQNPPPASSDF